LKILLTNDDGIDAIGIQTLAKELQKKGHQIIVVAPNKEKSASSHSITIWNPLHVQKHSENQYSVSGTPVDCVCIATEILAKDNFDLVISGINSGQNMGEDVLYSGTVAAAIEALLLGHKAIAISVNEYQNQNFLTAAKIMVKLLDESIIQFVSDKQILNINVPNIDFDKIKGYKITRTGHRKYRNFIHQQKDPRGRDIFWVGGTESEWSNISGTDFSAVNSGYVSITPIYPKFTNEDSINELTEFIENRKL